MSAGIACNKLLAKVAAGLHKPDQQTIVPPRYCIAHRKCHWHHRSTAVSSAHRELAVQ